MHSTLFEVFGLPIRAYGSMMVVGFCLGLWRAVMIAKRNKIESERVFDLAFVVLISGIIGSRLVYILLNLDTESFARFYAIWEGGLSFHGGVIFALLAGIFYTKRYKLSYWVCADLFAPSVAIAYAFTRIGCFLNGCCYGAPTSLPWGVRFNENGILTPPSHPVQIYAFIANIIIFFILSRLERLRSRPGFVFACYIWLYGVYRFLAEFLRSGYSGKVLAMGLTEAQWVSAVMIVVGFTAAIRLRRSK